MGKLPKTRLKVFISSAMSEESGTQWKKIRESIKNKLRECDYLSPFTIEENVNEISSIEYFLLNIKISDIIVILVKDKIRDGTKLEILKAIELKKPMLVYFCNSAGSSESIQEFRKELIKTDALTFKEIADFDNIDKVVLNDVINNILCYYQYKHIDLEAESDDEEEELISNNVLLDNSLLGKKNLDHFGNNRNTLIELLELSNYATINDENVGSSIAKKLLKWTFKGTNFITEQEMSTLFSEFSLSKEIEKILRLRFKSTQKYFGGNLEEALENLDRAYELGKKEKVPNWLLSEILIDSRNIKNQLGYYQTEYQQKLDTLESIVHFPIADRFLKMAYENLEKERFRERNASANTMHFGNTLLDSLQYAEKYLYISFVMGSSTHLLVARKKFTELLIGYGDLYKDENLIYQALKLYTLSGDQKNFSKVLETDWNRVSNILAVNVEELWHLTDAKYSTNSNLLKCVITKSLGQYMKNGLFMQATSYLIKYSSDLKNYEQGVLLLNAIDNNFIRFGNSYVLSMILNILKSDKITLYQKVTDLLSKIDLSGCDESDLKELEIILKEKISEIIENNGNPEFIVNLLNQSNIYSDLLDSIIKKVHENISDIIDIELGNYEKSNKILQNNISLLKERFNPSSNVYIRYVDNPLVAIEYIIKQCPSNKLFEILNNEFIPLLIEVLSAPVTLIVKQEYLKTLVVLLTEYKRSEIAIPELLTNFFGNDEIKLEEVWSTNQSSVVSSFYYVTTIKSLLNLNSENEILTFCVNYKQNSRREREAFSFSIQKFIEYNITSNQTIPSFINLVVMDMLQDNYIMVRKNAIKCALLLYSATPSEVLENELIRMTIDVSPNVKFYFINQLSKQILDTSMTQRLLSLFEKDGSYAIRLESKKMLSIIDKVD
ncbi:hypothetical protein QUD55_02580 [Lactococcus lactis]|uniref:DUF4062 domain-containing protein n=1 Tax=Lactococcus lactis TaxID=1358 RepID=A0AAW5TW41_9LACT|nr:hypothetical protein [Lactococcus lactis]MCW2281225.1 hypothetical protein [Lactococcus lactis]MDM7536361.1 hypothetical protein [Lactococcus lactis]